jgi:uncharacterized integral membrane protein
MQFLKTLFWVLVAVVVALFANRNWHDVTLNLWGDIQADIKLPVLLGLVFLVSFLPPFLLYRARLWAARRREPRIVAPVEAAPAASETALP